MSNYSLQRIAQGKCPCCGGTWDKIKNKCSVCGTSLVDVDEKSYKLIVPFEGTIFIKKDGYVE